MKTFSIRQWLIVAVALGLILSLVARSIHDNGPFIQGFENSFYWLAWSMRLDAGNGPNEGPHFTQTDAWHGFHAGQTAGGMLQALGIAAAGIALVVALIVNSPQYRNLK